VDLFFKKMIFEGDWILCYTKRIKQVVYVCVCVCVAHLSSLSICLSLFQCNRHGGVNAPAGRVCVCVCACVVKVLLMLWGPKSVHAVTL